MIFCNTSGFHRGGVRDRRPATGDGGLQLLVAGVAGGAHVAELRHQHLRDDLSEQAAYALD